MANVANCKKCGALFLQSGKRHICDKCFEEQNKLISEINSYVTLSGEQFIPVEDIMTKFNITRNEFEAFFLAGKFVRISNKVTIKCAKCGKIIPIENRTNFLCNECAKKLQNEI